MLTRRQQKAAPLESAFNDWWMAQSESFRESVSMLTARSCFRGGYTAGKHADERRFVFRAGRMRITVWAINTMEAKAKAEAEANFRAHRNGWPKPKLGWQLREEKCSTDQR
ncbi:hypothetical protein [Rhizobium sp. BT-175]|uniref:hypothetical protein n=1 Tax=Rhizobium sp. BT-175 TaxID=2986929 RepID=UPI0022368A6B|nr:hypothetical protein [Rhizobium sp. BT-175]MCV9942977.1 hypothetical protein [Rhizobium sp. BT-175]